MAKIRGKRYLSLINIEKKTAKIHGIPGFPLNATQIEIDVTLEPKKQKVTHFVKYSKCLFTLLYLVQN